MLLGAWCDVDPVLAIDLTPLRNVIAAEYTSLIIEYVLQALLQSFRSHGPAVNLCELQLAKQPVSCTGL